MPWVDNLKRRPLRTGDPAFLFLDPATNTWRINRTVKGHVRGALTAGPVTVCSIAANGKIFVRKQLASPQPPKPKPTPPQIPASNIKHLVTDDDDPDPRNAAIEEYLASRKR